MSDAERMPDLDIQLDTESRAKTDVKQEVRQFYDLIGWQLTGDLVYQNARYEDLRPVSGEYIHRCHVRVARHINPGGRYLLDAGSGPIQYKEYLEYSRNYQYRVCADISITALQEARRRISGHGLFVVADIANLPFKSQTFEGEVSLHTIHHLPENEHLAAYQELYRVLFPGCSAAVVNGWPASRLMLALEPLVRLANRLRSLSQRVLEKERQAPLHSRRDHSVPKPPETTLTMNDRQLTENDPNKLGSTATPKGTFTNRHDFAWVKDQVSAQMPLEIFVWRSVSVRFLRALIHPWLGGHYWLRLLFWLEERYPHYFGQNGQYPLIVIRKV